MTPFWRFFKRHLPGCGTVTNCTSCNLLDKQLRCLYQLTCHELATCEFMLQIRSCALRAQGYPTVAKTLYSVCTAKASAMHSLFSGFTTKAAHRAGKPRSWSAPCMRFRQCVQSTRRSLVCVRFAAEHTKLRYAILRVGVNLGIQRFTPAA